MDKVIIKSHVTTDEAKQIKIAAAVIGVNTSEFIRTNVLKAASKLVEDFKKKDENG